MAPILFVGPLHPKKKSELQDIAIALRLDDYGTRDELQARIKKHLDKHSHIEADPVFAGLYGRRKKSVQPPPPSVPTESKQASLMRRGATVNTELENTLVKDHDDISSFLNNSSFPNESSPERSPQRTLEIPLPPPSSPIKKIIEQLSKPPDVNALVKQVLQENEIVQNGNEMLNSLRAFLSNSSNVWSLTAIFELLFILNATIPWESLDLSLSPRSNGGYTIHVYYPSYTFFQTSAFWLVLLHWAIPTLIAPALIGNLISFNPAKVTSGFGGDTFDPLTASTVRLAGQFGYPYASLEQRFGIVGLDVLGSQWRVLNASVGLAFAYAEAIAGAPQVLIQALAADSESPPSRRVLMPTEDVVGESEVD